MINFANLHLPVYCYGQGFFVALGREILDGNGLKTRKRQQRDIVELAVGGYGAGVSTVNALDIAEMHEEIEVMKGQMRTAVKDPCEDAEMATDLSQQSIIIGRHELTPYRNVAIVEADDLKRTDDDQWIHRYIQKGLPYIPHLRADWEAVTKDSTQIDHLWNKERELINTRREG
ncbi:hypothetical protein scyTo_0010185 [Scyliorhinus torazame]|uniref:Uncharacterized protein n=1 Tax=Scyliorhinus torazame TaxID=75743 RepID=A0A401P1N1_SCYTO|nr:hypothetical protein [Scyliorhinus torazame]